MASSTADLHIFFLPLLTPGHMIPMLDLSVLISARGIRSTIITTPSNADLLRLSLSDYNNPNIHLHTIPFISETSLHHPENLTSLPTPEVTPDFFASLCGLESHVENLLLTHRPDCIISDIFYPWTTALAKRHGIPRIVFHGTSYFAFTLMSVISLLRLYDSVSTSDDLFLVPGLPHPIKMTRSQLPQIITSPPEFTTGFAASWKENYGMFQEIRAGLEAAGRPFVWVVREDPVAEGNVPVSGEGSVGFVIKGWAPQLAILKHQAVGAFLTHCGWNSCLEGIAAGVPMITWPLFSDQQFNERLLVDVLGVGVGVGSVVNSMKEEERTVVVAEKVAAAVEAVLGGGQEAEERRRKAKEMKAAAAKAVEEGGSSEVELGRMVDALWALKMGGTKEVAGNGVISADCEI
ncbi:hypothetical protein KFK09_005570 [Dendrobium nobile]|uniref:Glycosyltransferase n=1 Tax=Dendrobium nobile TaxID=94219 RepID=A0A8T3BZJ3_DENNO|nr:hypothetical protein KFK09_005570 [Dendrobium nobile]